MAALKQGRPRFGAHAGPRKRRERTSTLLAAFRAAPGGSRVSLADITTATHGRAQGVLLVVLGLPETIPMIGFSLILAIPIAIIGLYMMIHGHGHPLPKWLLRRTVPRSVVHRAIDASLPRLRQIENVLKPRWPVLAAADRFIGLVIVLMAILLAAPIPGINILAALAVVLTGLGLLQRDGIVIAAALAFSTAALGALALLIMGGALVISEWVPVIDSS